MYVSRLTQVTFETLLAFAVLTLGCALTTPPLKEIAWATELRSEYVSTLTQLDRPRGRAPELCQRAASRCNALWRQVGARLVE